MSEILFNARKYHFTPTSNVYYYEKPYCISINTTTDYKL